MPIIKSQKKRVLTNEKARQRNIAVRSRMRTYLKRVDSAFEAKDGDEMKSTVAAAIVEIDKAASKGVLHQNSAARKKSSLCRRLAAAQSSN